MHDQQDTAYHTHKMLEALERERRLLEKELQVLGLRERQRFLKHRLEEIEHQHDRSHGHSLHDRCDQVLRARLCHELVELAGHELSQELHAPMLSEDRERLLRDAAHGYIEEHWDTHLHEDFGWRAYEANIGRLDELDALRKAPAREFALAEQNAWKTELAHAAGTPGAHDAPSEADGSDAECRRLAAIKHIQLPSPVTAHLAKDFLNHYFSYRDSVLNVEAVAFERQKGPGLHRPRRVWRFLWWLLTRQVWRDALDKGSKAPANPQTSNEASRAQGADTAKPPLVAASDPNLPRSFRVLLRVFNRLGLGDEELRGFERNDRCLRRTKRFMAGHDARGEKRHQLLQRHLSSATIYVTRVTGYFMVAMMLVGIAQLGYALSAAAHLDSLIEAAAAGVSDAATGAHKPPRTIPNQKDKQDGDIEGPHTAWEGALDGPSERLYSLTRWLTERPFGAEEKVHAPPNGSEPPTKQDRHEKPVGNPPGQPEPAIRANASDVDHMMAGVMGPFLPIERAEPSASMAATERPIDAAISGGLSSSGKALDSSEGTPSNELAKESVDQNSEATQEGPDTKSDESGRHLKGSSKAMEKALHALEIILVAPLPYLLMLGLSRYIKALAFRERVDQYRKELLDFKGFEVALFIAIVAAVAVGKTLEDKLTWQTALASGILIAVLGAYFFVIEWRSGEDEKLEIERDRLRAQEESQLRLPSTSEHGTGGQPKTMWEQFAQRAAHHHVHAVAPLVRIVSDDRPSSRKLLLLELNTSGTEFASAHQMWIRLTQNAWASFEDHSMERRPGTDLWFSRTTIGQGTTNVAFVFFSEHMREGLGAQGWLHCSRTTANWEFSLPSAVRHEHSPQTGQHAGAPVAPAHP